MSRSSNDSSWGRRRSLFAVPTLHSINSNDEVSTKPTKSLKKTLHRRAPSLFTDLNHPDVARDGNDIKSAPPVSDPPRFRRSSLNIRNSLRNSPSTPGKSSVQSSSDDLSGDAFGEPLSSTPSSATSYGFGEGSMDNLASAMTRTLLLHGEVQTSAGMFRKKKEYVVLTETHLLRYKSQAKAADTFKVIPSASGRPSVAKHGTMPSVGSQSDLQTLSDSSGDKSGRLPLRQIVAVCRVDDGKPYFALELCYLDEESAQSSALTITFTGPEERDAWLYGIRAAANDARLRDQSYIAAFNVENAARIVERENDYDPANCAIYKIIQRQTTSKPNRSSTDDLTKVNATVCFMAIGIHKVHIIQLTKASARSASPTLGPTASQASFGILTLSSLKVGSFDDSLELSFRQPLYPAKHLHLASTASHEIAARLRFSEHFLRPECGHRLFKFSAPPEIESLLSPSVPSGEEHNCLDRTLAAYCVAYNLNPTIVRYTINYNCEDAPRFELLPPSDTRRPEYGPIALLAIFRALRYNESFGSLSFAGVSLDPLNGLHDNNGSEYLCSRTKRGTPIKLTVEELGRSCLLVQEIRALAASSKKLRRLDFSACLSPGSATTMETSEDEPGKTKDIGCGIVEALAPLCRQQTTNVDWICLNGIQLSDTDMDYLVSAAVDKSCHFRGIELNRCGLNDRNMGLLLDSLRAHENTLEAIEISNNTARLDPSIFDSQLSMFGFIRKLNLSHLSRTSGKEPLVTAETLLMWRLQELRLSGTQLNSSSIDAVATYLAHPQSRTLHELYVDHAYLSGGDVATLLHSLTDGPSHPRDLHLDISQSLLTRGLEKVTKAITDGLTPTNLSMRAIEYREESQYRKMINALTTNKTIRYLDMSQTALPGDAGDETCRALSRLLAENTALLELDISGEDSRLASSKFGPGINEALAGLKRNKSLQTFRVEKQKLGLQGASTLAEVLKDNFTLRELHCANNEIPLQGLTDLVNSLIENTTLVYLPSMIDGREAAFRTAELTMKGMSDPDAPLTTPGMRSVSFGTASNVRRGLSTVRKSAARAASAYTPAFPALPSYSRNTSSPDGSRNTSPLSLHFHHSRPRQNSQTSLAPTMSFTVQDIQTTHRLLTEQWDRQCYRLAQYLDRNWCLLNAVPVNMEVEDEKFERPESVGSLGKVLEQAKSGTTPRNEKEAYFDSPQEMQEIQEIREIHPPLRPLNTTATTMVDGKHPISFKQFILESGPSTPDALDDVETKAKQLRIDTSFEHYEEPKTPTQGQFNV